MKKIKNDYLGDKNGTSGRKKEYLHSLFKGLFMWEWLYHNQNKASIKCKTQSVNEPFCLELRFYISKLFFNVVIFRS